MKYKWGNCMAALLLCITIVSPVLFPAGMQVKAAAGRAFSLKQAQTLALAADKNYQRTYNKIEMKKVKYVAAIKSIEMKKKNMRTFRWTPLLSFKFPEQPKLVDEYEWQYKPIQIQSEITALEHKLNDCKYEVIETVSLLYTQAYVCQEKIAYLQSMILELEKDLKRIQTKAATGGAKQADADKLKQSIEKNKSDLVLQMRTYETKKEKISDKVKMDVKSGYRFENPLVEADIPRSSLPDLVNYTLDHDQNYYEVKLNESISLTSLTMTESFMRNQYGGKMNQIQSYVNQAKSGGDINQIAFKKSYDQFLKEIDEPWNGYYRFLFIKISKEWFKGAISGSRYVEDDPYALYTASLDYADAREEKIAAQKDLTGRVKDQYESLITARNAYEILKASNVELGKEVSRGLEQNRMGKLPYEELKALQDEYQKAQIEELNMLDNYSQLLYSYNRLTCGAISIYLRGNSIQWNMTSGGDSFVTADEIEGAYYYIESKIEDRLFILGVQIPENFKPDITHYELWVNETRVGQKLSTDQQLRHLTLDFDEAQSVRIKLFNEDKLVEICEIDSGINRAPLLIRDNYRVEDKKKGLRKVAAYTWKSDREKNLITLHFQKETGEAVAFYTLSEQNGKNIYQADPVPISQDYTYLSILASDFSKLRITFYDENKEKLYIGTFDSLTGSIYTEGGTE